MTLCPPFPPLQFALYSFSDQVRALLALVKNGVHTIQCALWKASRNLVVIYLFSAHAKI